MLLIAGGVYFSPVKAEAKSVSFSPSYTAMADGECRDWYLAYTILYKGNVYNDTLGGVLLNDGDSIPVGTQIRFQDGPYLNTDISWFLTGFAADSPYGAWVVGATQPPPSSFSALNFGGYSFNLALSVDPPLNVSAVHSGTAGLSCDVSGMHCTVTSPGTINSSVVFTNRPYQWVDALIIDDCTSGATGLENNINLFDSVYGITPVSEQRDFIGDTAPSGIPSQQINFSLTAIANNNPPAAPTVICPPDAFVNTDISCSASAADPDGDAVRYDYDWDNNGSVDQSAPSSGYVPSNTLQALVHSYITASSKTINVRAVDSKGSVSGWGSAVTVVSDPIKTVSLSPLVSTITLGQSVTFSSTASFSDNTMIQHNLNWRKQGGFWNWEVGYIPVATVTISNYTFVPTGSHPLNTTLTPTQTGTYDVYAAASSDGVTWTSSLVATVTVAAPPVCTIATAISWTACTSSATCTAPPATQTVTGTRTGMCADSSIVIDNTCSATITCTSPTSVCPNAVCEAGETPLTCPRDCKVKFRQF